jgi:drug/metabolite transporter (DMT)-like permease
LGSSHRGPGSDRVLNRPALTGAGLVLIAAIGYGTLPTVSRFAGEAGISTVAFVTWRSIIGASLLTLAVLLMVRSGRMTAPRFGEMTRLHRVQVAAVAGVTILINLALFTAFEQTSIAIVMICFYTFPVMVATASMRLYGEPLTTSRVAALLLALAGMLLVVLAPALGQEGVKVEPIGIVLGLVAAVFQAIYALIAGRGYPTLSAPQAAMTITSVAAVGYVVVALLGGSAVALLEPFEGGGWIWLLLGAVIGLAIPTAAVLAGFRQLGPTRASILMLLEPVAAVFLAAVFIAERPSPLQLAGGLMVLAGGALAQMRWRSRETDTTQEEIQQAEAELL